MLPGRRGMTCHLSTKFNRQEIAKFFTIVPDFFFFFFAIKIGRTWGQGGIGRSVIIYAVG